MLALPPISLFSRVALSAMFGARGDVFDGVLFQEQPHSTWLEICTLFF
jgi:hypothetical protein